MSEIAHLMHKYISIENLELNLLTLTVVPLLSCIQYLEILIHLIANIVIVILAKMYIFAKMYTGKPVRHLCML